MTAPTSAPATAPSPATNSAPRPIRQAATLIVLRDGADGLEALLLRRADKANDQNSGATVFPGGILDAHDRRLHDFCAGIDDAWASARLGLAEGGLDHYAAAVRECFEESGLLFARDAKRSGALVDLDGLDRAQLDAMRQAAAIGTDALLSLCDAQGWQLAMDRLIYFSHWLTPPGMPRRFDTRFFVALVPPGQSVQVDGVEIVQHAWMRPADAIDPARGLKLMNVTRRILEQLATFSSAKDCLTHAQGLRDIPLTMPRLALGRGGSLRPVNTEEAAYWEIAFVDPDGRGNARYALEAGLVLQLRPGVWRVTASDADGGPGPHSYFVSDGHGTGDWALIDPVVAGNAAAQAAHLAALRAAAPGAVRWILSTGGEVLQKEAWPEAQWLAPAPGDELPLGNTVLRTLDVLGSPNARRFLLMSEALLITGGAEEDDPPVESAWLAPARGFVRAIRR